MKKLSHGCSQLLWKGEENQVLYLLVNWQFALEWFFIFTFAFKHTKTAFFYFLQSIPYCIFCCQLSNYYQCLGLWSTEQLLQVLNPQLDSFWAQIPLEKHLSWRRSFKCTLPSPEDVHAEVKGRIPRISQCLWDQPKLSALKKSAFLKSNPIIINLENKSRREIRGMYS